MRGLQDYELTPWAEFSILCDRCGINESTRDGNRTIALEAAVAEGFQHLGDDEDILCPECLAKEPATAAAGN